MDIVYLHGIKVETVIGVWDWERQIKQTLLVDIDVGTDSSRAGQTDALADTINYQQVAETVVEIARENSFALVERLAEEIANRLLGELNLQHVKIRINKQGAVRGVRDVGVIIERQRV